MAKQSEVKKLALRYMRIEELRDLATRFTTLEPDVVASNGKEELLTLLSAAANSVPSLARELRKGEITLKPSFYLMSMAAEADRPDAGAARKLLNKRLRDRNATIDDRSGYPPFREFALENVRITGEVVEIHFTWQQVIWYWAAPDLSYEHVYTLQFGLALLDFRSCKALFACHSERERDVLSEEMSSIYKVSLAPLVLTKPLLEQIGTVDRLKKAGYFNDAAGSADPENITYADDDLALKSVVQAAEGSHHMQRKYSFYRIPLNSIVEEGVGVTSDSGKVWLPKETPVPALRDYGLALLGKIGRTLDQMSHRGEIEKVLSVLGIQYLPSVSAIKPMALRRAICGLSGHLINMLLCNESERPYLMPATLAFDGVPKLFNYPRLILSDEATGEITYWSNEDRTSQLLKLKPGAADQLVEVPSGAPVPLESLLHPLTDEPVAIGNPLERLHLTPAMPLITTLLAVIRHVANTTAPLKALRDVVALPFYISGNVLRLDVERAFGRPQGRHLDVELLLSDVRELMSASKQEISADDRDVRRRLVQLGEKCRFMSDDNCQSCTRKKKYLCLRSLIGHFFSPAASRILAHKGIELCDLQLQGHVGAAPVRIFGFAKLANGKGGLTVRNNNGAILLAQVLGQIDKAVFDTVCVISPSPINDDLRERLAVLCGVFNKRLLVLDFESLGKLLLDFEERAEFDGIDVQEMYAASHGPHAKRPTAATTPVMT
jgi:hypothetical protein